MTRSSAQFPFLFLSRNVTTPFFRLVTLVRKRGYTNHNQRTHCVPQRINCRSEGPFISVRNVKSYLSEGLQIVTTIMFYRTLCYTHYIENDIGTKSNLNPRPFFVKLFLSTRHLCQPVQIFPTCNRANLLAFKSGQCPRLLFQKPECINISE